MPNTPQVKFNIINHNIEKSSPTLGISTVLCRTTKGHSMDPFTLITSLPQFKRIYGSEIVPDGSISNIETALLKGSKLHIIRVVGPGATPGKVKLANPAETAKDFLIKIAADGKAVTIKAITRSNGDPIGSGDTFTVTTKESDNSLVYSVIGADGTILDSGSIINYHNADALNNTSIDYISLSNFIFNNPYLKLIISGDNTASKSLESVESLLNWLAKIDGSRTKVTITGSETNTYTIGTSETKAPESKEWIDALDLVYDCIDSYHVGLSHIHQHLSQVELFKVYKAAKEIVDEADEFQLYIEIPKFKVGTNEPMKDTDMIAYKKSVTDAIGHSKWISYFGGGLMYSNDNGIQQSSDVLGTVLGLADTSGSVYSYSRSFSGLNRGVVPDANGTVCPNYGGPGRISNLSNLAAASINLFVVKDTPSYGKQTVLWHNFTDQVKKDSFRFIGVTGLILNIKKTLRPILDSFIEEPNHWSTWAKIYLEVQKPISNWVDNSDITDPVWQGDQNATSWKDLVINTENEVRQGRYKTIFTFKDVLSLQEMNVTLAIDSSSKVTTVKVNN